VHVGEEQFMLDQDFVLMDLEPEAVDHKSTTEKDIYSPKNDWFEGKLSMIRLFPKEPVIGKLFGASYMVPKGNKLIKYHISYS
jgi:hypothetical protein